MSHQRYGASRRGRPPHQQYRMSPRGPPREQHHSYRTPPQTGPPPSQREGVYANPHVGHAVTSLVGNLVEVKLTSGVVYEGICSSVSPKLDIVLEAVHDKDKPAVGDNVQRFTRFNFSDIVHVTSREEANRKHGASDIFKTDTEISQSNGSSVTRSLQPFDFDEDSSVEHLDSDSTGWSVDDMFQVNREKFAVNSTYDSDMAEYTTKLERQDTETFRQREERAKRIAMEIESTSKNKLGIDDTGTEEEMFSAVVRQEVAQPPPPLETTPLCPNGHGEVPSIKSDSGPPAAAATQVATSSAKTDTSSAGTSDSQPKTTSDARLAPEDTPPSSTTGDGGSCKDAESASTEKVTEVKEPQGGEEAKEVKDGKDEREKVPAELEKATPTEATASGSGGGEPPAKKEVEGEASGTSEVKTTESIRKFKLDPNAKVFTPGSFSLPSTPISSPSPAPSSSSSTRSASSTPYLSGKKPTFRQGGRQGRSQHQHVPAVSTFFQPDVASFIPAQSMAQAAGFVIQSPFVRPALHTPPTSGQVYYTPVPQYPGPGGIIAPQPGLIPPQQLVAAAASPKFVTEIPAQPQVIAGQHFPQTSQTAAHQFISPPTQALLQPTVSQPQLVPTPQGLVSAHQPVFVQGNLATATGAAVTAGGLVGGAPFTQFHQQTLAVASANQPGVAGAQQVTPNRPLFQHQSHPVGK